MTTYRTKDGDTWDLVAYQQLGSCRFTEKLIDANRKFVDTVIFAAGIELTLPDISTERKTVLPPWRTGL